MVGETKQGGYPSPYVLTCGNCEYKAISERRPRECPACGGVLTDLTVARGR